MQTRADNNPNPIIPIIQIDIDCYYLDLFIFLVHAFTYVCQTVECIFIIPEIDRKTASDIVQRRIKCAIRSKIRPSHTYLIHYKLYSLRFYPHN